MPFLLNTIHRLRLLGRTNEAARIADHVARNAGDPELRDRALQIQKSPALRSYAAKKGLEMSDGGKRDLTRTDARRLGPGEEHYTAYIGPPGQYDFMGATQFRLLTALGLRSHHKVLDLGCGSLRAGRFLIMYLDPDGYFGIEPNTWLIDDAIEREVGRDLIRLKRPVFSDTEKFDAGQFGVQFDFIVAQSIFSHTGPDLASLALRHCGQSLKDSGIFLATFIHRERLPAAPVEASGWTYPGCTTFEPHRIHELIASAGLTGRALPWYHPRQTWYVLAKSSQALPSREFDGFLSGAVLREPSFAASTSTDII